MGPFTPLPVDDEATKALTKMLGEFNEQSSKQTVTMIQLTAAILVLTAVMTVAVGVQIWVTLR